MIPPPIYPPPPFDETLRRYAKQLNSLRQRQRFARPSYDVLGDALFWPDEMPTGNPTDLILALRGLFYHRTGLIIGKTRGGAELWRLGLKLFRHWVGFDASRCMPSPWLARIYRAYSSFFSARSRNSINFWTNLRSDILRGDYSEIF